MIDETSSKPDQGTGSDSPIDSTPALPTRRSVRAAAANTVGNTATQPQPVAPALSGPTVAAGTVSAAAPAAPRLSSASATVTTKVKTRVEARQSRWKSIRSLLIVAVAVPAIFGTVALPAYAFTEETAAVAPIHDTGAQSLTVPDWTRPELGRDSYSATTAAELESARAAKAAAEAAAAAAKLAASRPAARSGYSGTYTGSANDPELAAFLVGRSDIWQRSVPGSISSPYGPRGLICNSAGCSNSFHDGVDFTGSCGTPVKAVSAGRVTFTGSAGAYGQRVIVDHGGGVESIYGHVQTGSFRVSPGQLIEAGTVVASIGATGVVSGCHLDLKIRLGGDFTNPVPYMASRGVKL